MACIDLEVKRSKIRVGVRVAAGVDFCMWILPRDAMLGRHMMSSCVRLSVCPSQLGVILKRIKAPAVARQSHTIAQAI